MEANSGERGWDGPSMLAAPPSSRGWGSWPAARLARYSAGSARLAKPSIRPWQVLRDPVSGAGPSSKLAKDGEQAAGRASDNVARA